MVTAFILLNVQRGRITPAAQAMLAIDGVTEVHSVSGDYDLVAVVRVRRNDDLAELVTDRLAAVEGLLKSHTLIAFRQYSEYDLARMFELGDE